MIALFQLFLSGSTRIKGHLQSVSYDGERFVAFVMSKAGANILARSRVVDMDMTFQCTWAEVNMVKFVVMDSLTNVSTTVAQAWVNRQDAEMYYMQL